MRKGEIAHYEQFLLFSQCFQKLSSIDESKHEHLWSKGLTYRKRSFENIVGKGENTGNQHFPFPTMFSDQ